MKDMLICMACGFTSCVLAEIWPQHAWTFGWAAGVIYMNFAAYHQSAKGKEVKS